MRRPTRRSWLLTMARLLCLAVAVAAAAAETNTTASWLAKRAALIKAMLGYDGLPTKRTPDAIKPLGPAFNTSAGVSELTWELSDPKFFKIDSRVFHVPAAAGKRTKEAFVFHHGHTDCRCPVGPANPCANPPFCPCSPNCQSGADCPFDGPAHHGCAVKDGYTWYDLYNTTRFLHSLGHDVFLLSMPLRGVNKGRLGGPGGGFDDHWWFAQWEAQGDHPLRYFLEPIFLTINYATEVLGYEAVHMAGLSGGGWSTTVAAAMDPRIKHSFPIAGSVPDELRDPDAGYDAEDYEQNASPNPNPAVPIHPGRPGYQACNYTCQYVLGGLEPGRTQVQVLHEFDDCCFAPGYKPSVPGVPGHPERHAAFLAYEARVRAELQGGPARERAEPTSHGWFTVVADNHTHHEVARQDKEVIRAVHARLWSGAPPGAPAWDELPCDILHKTGGKCPYLPD